ncbi:MAG: leucine-rich repeat protein [Clostridia bacterium]|nr:leucine-rich repeat protein [Clostridia bacterium]
MAGISKKTEYTRAYRDIVGVELGGSGTGISKNRLSYAENVWRDYRGEGGGIIESVPGFRRLADLGARIHSIVWHSPSPTDERLLIHAGSALYSMPLSERDSFTPGDPICKLPDRKCPHFKGAGRVYYLTGSDVIAVEGEGKALSLNSGELSPYEPILYQNGSILEQRNLLTPSARERYIVTDPSRNVWETPGIRYTVLDEGEGTCAATGFDRDYEGVLSVPSVTVIAGREYRVTEIGDYAFFLATLVSEIRIAEGVERIGAFAFSYCKRATAIYLPRTVKEIGMAAFDNCGELTDCYLGIGLSKIGSSPFHLCDSLNNVHYAGVEEQLKKLEGYDQISDKEFIFGDEDRTALIKMPLFSHPYEVFDLYDGEKTCDFEPVYENDVAAAIIARCPGGWDRILTLTAKVDLGSSPFKEGLEGVDAITGATVAESFDNRVFLAGSPGLYNTVFYSAPLSDREGDLLYFGEHNYLTDGVGEHPVVALLAAGERLAVFKAGDDGSGSIFYHTPSTTSDSYMPRIYPTSYVHSGIAAQGAAINFLDDPVFISEGGLFALDKVNIDKERSVVCRSDNVNYDLQKLDLRTAMLAEWCGYLVVAVGDCFYLADSRATFRHPSGATEYEWFVIKGVGSHEGDEEVWRFDSYETGDVFAHPDEGGIFEGVAYSVDTGGKTVYYGIIDGVKYSLYRTGERRGGTLSLPTAIYGRGELLFFGTESGALLLFNNDKRGVTPKHLASMEGFDAEEYKRVMGHRLHPSFYPFDGHAVRYAVKTAYDDCGIPHLRKSTVKNSLTVKVGALSGALLHCEVGTESSDYKGVTSFPASALSFDELDLASSSLLVSDHETVPIPERAKGWVEKQITFYTDGYATPIGIYNIAYRYTVSGRVKRS